MVSKEMIVLEDGFKAIFDYLPLMKNSKAIEFKPTFMYGDNKQLLDFLRQHKTGTSVYPLIWLVYPYQETHGRSEVDFDGITFILAVETNSVMLNNQRMRETYSNVLIPLFNNIKEAFKQASNLSTGDEYVITKFPNYSDVQRTSDDNKATYVWDAMTISFDGQMTSNCLQPIIF
jgi:hypothetical protein